MKSLYLTYCECCDRWGIDGREIRAFSEDVETHHNGQILKPDRRYRVHFFWQPVQSFSLREAVNEIAKAAAEKQN